jgi:hypothetical protein
MGNLQSAAFLHSSGLSQELVVTTQLVPNTGDSSGTNDTQRMVSVWSQETFHDKPLTLLQSVNVSFPLIASLSEDGSYHADMLVDPTKHKGFILLSHR